MTLNEAEFARGGCAVCNPEGHPSKSYDELFAESRAIVEPEIIIAAQGPHTFSVIDMRGRYREDEREPFPEVILTRLSHEAAELARNYVINCEAEPTGRGLSLGAEAHKYDMEREFLIKGRIMAALRQAGTENVETAVERVYMARPWDEPVVAHPDDEIPF